MPGKFKQLREAVDPAIIKQWEDEQERLKTQLIERDDFDWSLAGPNPLTLIGGMDISADKDNPTSAFAALVVLRFPSLDLVYEDCIHVTVDVPYVPGCLAFREVPHLMQLLDRNRQTPHVPQVVLLDGNGIFHCKGFGLASHFGVLSGLPTIGCGKTVFAVDGLNKGSVRALSQTLQNGGDHVELVGRSGRVWGAALKCCDNTTDPLIVSVGHKISLGTAVDLVKRTCIYRVPEPIRQADKLSRSLVKSSAAQPPVS